MEAIVLGGPGDACERAMERARVAEHMIVAARRSHGSIRTARIFALACGLHDGSFGLTTNSQAIQEVKSERFETPQLLKSNVSYPTLTNTSPRNERRKLQRQLIKKSRSWQ